MELSEKLKPSKAERNAVRTSAHVVANAHLSALKTKNEEKRRNAAQQLFRYVSGDLKDESPEFTYEFLIFLDNARSEQSCVHECIYSPELEEKKAGIYLIVCLADTTLYGSSDNRVVRFANYLLKVLTMPNMDEAALELAGRALAFLIQTSKSYSAELVDKCLDQCLEWLQEVQRNEQRRMASVILMRELAIFTSTSFFLRANLFSSFFKGIFNVIRDPKPHIRIASIHALHAALTIVSQREAKQKSEWYKTCHTEATATLNMQNKYADLNKDDRYHSSLLVLNELVRIADADFERKRKQALNQPLEPAAVHVQNPIDFLQALRQPQVVGSKTAKTLVEANFAEIYRIAITAVIDCRATHVQQVLLELLPRLSASGHCSDDQLKAMFEHCSKMFRKDANSLVAAGLLALQNPDHYRLQFQQALMIMNEMVHAAVNKKRIPDPSVFIAYSLYVNSYKEAACDEMRRQLPHLFKTGLSDGLTRVLHSIMRNIATLRVDVQDGLMKELYFLITGAPLPNKIDAPSKPELAQRVLKVQNETTTILALNTLGSFQFQRHYLKQLVQLIADVYLVYDSVDVRLAAVTCCCSILRPFVEVYRKVRTNHREHREWLLALIDGVLRCLLRVGVVDPKVEVRLRVLDCFCKADAQFLSHLAQPDMLELQFMSLHDERLEMQEMAVSLLGKVAELNPALVVPRMRRIMLEMLSQLTISAQPRLEQHSARILTQLTRQNAKFVRPYLQSLLSALQPKIQAEIKSIDVTVSVLDCVSELCLLGGSEIVRSIDFIFPKLLHFISDSSSTQRKEAALRTMGRICQATAYVVDPYRDQPALLDELLRLLKTEVVVSLRRETIRLLGILGGLDPFMHKVFTGAVQSATSFTTALSLPTTRDAADPRQDILQWFNYEKCSLEQFYPNITIANLMIMVQDEAYSEYVQEITQAVLHIFHGLGDTLPEYVQQVMPRLIEVTRLSRARSKQREFFLQQLAQLVGIVRTLAKPYMKQILSLMADAWRDEHDARASLNVTIVSVLEKIAVALGQDFTPHLSELIPYVLQSIQTDKTDERKLTIVALSCVRSLCGSVSPHLHVLLPPILSIVDDHQIKVEVQMAAIDTVLAIAKCGDVVDYAPRLMQTWQRAIGKFELQTQLMDLLVEVVKQMWVHFEVFKRNVDLLLEKHGLNNSNTPFYHQYRKTAEMASASLNGQRPNGKMPTNNRVISGSATPGAPSTAQSVKNIVQITAKKQRINKEYVSRAWVVDGLMGKEEWTQWLSKLRMALIKSSSSSAIKAAAPLSDQHQHLSRDLFNAAFMSVWTELTEVEQDQLRKALETALRESNHQEVVQTILNLAEFMDHSEKGPLPISAELLGKSAEESRAYAKALRIKELEINRREDRHLTADDCQSLITFANKLNVHEEAAGVVRYAQLHKMQIPTLGRWYEKLNEWEKALEAYEAERIDDTSVHELRCLEALGRWQELNEKSKKLSRRDQKVSIMTARGAWAVGDWKTVEEIVSTDKHDPGHVNENSQEGAFLRAVLAVKLDKFSEAQMLIERVRDSLDSDLTATAGESYERAYGAMLLAQQLSELEEAIEFKLRPERRARIALLWSRRLQGCRQDIEQWQRLLMLRSLVLNKAEMHPLRVKFSSLCRRQGKQSMCRSVLRELLNLNPDRDLQQAQPPFDKPQLVLALCKQLWNDDARAVAMSTVEQLVLHLQRTTAPNKAVSPEHARLCAKAYIKLGEWTEATSILRSNSGWSDKPGSLNASPRGLDDPTTIQIHRVGSPIPSPVAPLTYYKRATEHDPKWHKAWHKLAVSHFHALAREKETQMLLQQQMAALGVSRIASPQPVVISAGGGRAMVSPTTAPILPPMISVGIPPQMSTVRIGMVGGVVGPIHTMVPISSMQSPTVTTAQHLDQMMKLAVGAVKCFTQALRLAPGSRLEDTLRLMQLWIDYSEYDIIFAELRESIKSLPVETWLEVIPQLMARMDSKDKLLQLVKQVLVDVSKSNPQALVYQLTVAAKSTNKDRAQNARDILKLVGEQHERLIQEAYMISEELVRCAILWHEQWHDALDEASRLYFQEKNTQGMLDVLSPLHNMIERGPTTLKESSFHQTYLGDLQDAYKFCQAYEKSNNAKELTQAWEIYCAIFKRISQQLRQLTTLDMSYMSPNLMKARDLQLAVPGTYDPSSEPVCIASIGPVMHVISSKQRPRKMTMRGSNGREYTFLLKGHEDPRQDERVMQLFGLVNTLLANNSETCRRNLTIQRYSITALSQNSGLIGWVPECDTLHSLVKDYREKKKMSLSLEHREMQKLAPETDQLMLFQKVQLFELALASSRGDDLREILWLKSVSSEVWFERRTNYTRAMACMSMVGYMLGLGDRHPSNLMLDRLTGKIVHIDFGDCFDVAMSREKFPEKIPFRLTRMLVNAMEVTGIEGTYRLTCERVLRVLRTNKQSLLAVLEAFVYDPLINWRLLDANKRLPGERQDQKKLVMQEAPRQVSQQVIDKIKHKLAGSENGELEVTECEQIERLVQQARMAENLCQCYIGWCPFW